MKSSQKLCEGKQGSMSISEHIFQATNDLRDMYDPPFLQLTNLENRLNLSTDLKKTFYLLMVISALATISLSLCIYSLRTL